MPHENSFIQPAPIHTICPASSLPVTTLEEFTNYNFGSYTSSLSKIGNNIVYLKLQGNLSYFSDEEYRIFFNNFVHKAKVNLPIIQIRDITERTAEIPLKEINKNNAYTSANADKFSAVIIIGVSRWLKLLLKTGVKFFPQPVKYFIANDYNHAVKTAINFENSNGFLPGNQLSESEIQFPPGGTSLNPVTGFGFRLGMIPGKIFYSQSEGYANDLNDINNYLKHTETIIKSLGFDDTKPYYAIVDVSRLQGNVSLKNKIWFANELKRIDKENNFKPTITIICGASFFFRSSFRLFAPLMNQRFVFTNNVEEAFFRINNIENKNQKSIDATESIMVQKNHIEEIIDYCGNLIWESKSEQEAIDLVSAGNPLKEVQETLEIIKNDFSALLLNYQAIFNDINCGIIVADIMQHRVLFVNKAAETILEITPEKETESSVFSILGFDPDDTQSREILLQVSRNKQITYHTSKGTEKHLSLSVSENIFENKNCFIYSLTDITAIRRAHMENENHLAELRQNKRMLLSMMEDTEEMNKKLKESEEKLSTLFASMTEMVVVHELVFNDSGEAVNYLITDANDAFTRITGIKKQDAVGKPATEVYHSETPPFLDIYSRVALTGESAENNIYYAPLDKHFTISVVSTGKNRFATVTSDVTQIRQAQQELELKNRELENYLYVASHDLRTPLINIHGFSQRLHSSMRALKEHTSDISIPDHHKTEMLMIMDEKIPRTIGFIDTNVDKMDKLINGLLQISRTGSVSMKIKELNMNKLIVSIIEANEFQIQQLHASIVTDDLTPCFGDENLINQLFSNLIGNALKYSDPDRDPVIEIHSQTQFRKAIYSVKDNGKGITERNLARIWDVFFRANTDESVKGEGIGLSIVKRIVEKHKGKVWAESLEGEGSTFYVELPNVVFSE